VAAILQWVEVYIAAHSEPEAGAASMPIRQKISPGLGITQRPREVHALFYTACQAAFYIMCFRGAEALHYYQQAWLHRDENDSPYAQPDSVNLGPNRWKLICNHPLQPLKYCLESVRVEFLHVAEELDLFLEDSLEVQTESQEIETKQFIDHLWRVNDEGNSHLRVDKTKTVPPSRKRSSIISTAATQEKKRLDGGVGGLGKGSNPLDSYFPFDPYLL
jgi:RNA polymerase I-specific transcription initiation factor RRN3